MYTHFDMPSMAMDMDLLLERAGAKALAEAAATRKSTNLNMFLYESKTRVKERD